MLELWRDSGKDPPVLPLRPILPAPACLDGREGRGIPAVHVLAQRHQGQRFHHEWTGPFPLPHLVRRRTAPCEATNVHLDGFPVGVVIPAVLWNARPEGLDLGLPDVEEDVGPVDRMPSVDLIHAVVCAVVQHCQLVERIRPVPLDMDDALHVGSRSCLLRLRLVCDRRSPWDGILWGNTPEVIGTMPKTGQRKETHVSRYAKRVWCSILLDFAMIRNQSMVAFQYREVPFPLVAP